MTTAPALSDHPLTTGGRAAVLWWAAMIASTATIAATFAGLYAYVVLIDQIRPLLVAGGCVIVVAAGYVVSRLRRAAAMHTPGALGQGPAAWRVTGHGAVRIIAARAALNVPLWVLLWVLLSLPASSRVVPDLETGTVTVGEVYAVAMAIIASGLLVLDASAAVVDTLVDWQSPARRARIMEGAVSVTTAAVLLVIALAAAPAPSWSALLTTGAFLGLIIGLLSGTARLDRLIPVRRPVRPQPPWVTRVTIALTPAAHAVQARLEQITETITATIHDAPTSTDRDRIRRAVNLTAAVLALAAALALCVTWLILLPRP